MLSKEYRIIDTDTERLYTLKGTTARVEKELTELGLIGDNSDAKLSEILGANDDRLLKLCNAVFRGQPFINKDLEDIDKHAVKEGVLDFFYKDVAFLTTLINSTKILNLPSPNQT